MTTLYQVDVVMLVLAVLLVLGVLAFLLLRLISSGSQCDPARLEQLLAGESASDHYRPMEKLLSESEMAFLVSSNKLAPSRIRQIRAQRRRLFRNYLAELSGDFGAMCFLLDAVMVQSAKDRPELGRAVFQIRLRFFFGLAKIHLRLGAHALGMSVPAIEVAALVKPLEAITSQLSLLQADIRPSLA